MPLTRKAVALSLGLTAILSAATIAQAPKQSSADSQLVIEDATVDWFQKSDISALREGVIERMELRIGKEVGAKIDGKGPVIGYLYRKTAELSVDEARIQAEGEGAIKKAKAQRDLALTVVARNVRLAAKNADFVAREEAEKAKAELAAADASYIEAQDTQKLAVAKLRTAEQALEEHIIRAPFSGQILEEFKHEGESVRANEPVVRIGNLDTVRVWAYIPLEYALRVTPGTEIEIEPRFGNVRTSKRFKGVISSVDQSIQPVAETAVRIYADIDNPGHILKPGLKATMTIKLKPEGTANYASPRPVNQASSTPTDVGARTPELPPLPR
jgi:RND family efflux transporter MFP subunit